MQIGPTHYFPAYFKQRVELICQGNFRTISEDILEYFNSSPMISFLFCVRIDVVHEMKVPSTFREAMQH